MNDPQSSPTLPRKTYRDRERLPVPPKHFKSSFVAYDRRLTQDSQFQKLSRCPRALLDWVHGITIGFQREWARVHSYEDVPYGHSALYEARNQLIQLGFIELRRDYKKKLWVRICPGYHCLAPERLAALEEPSWSRPTGKNVPENRKKTTSEIERNSNQINDLLDSPETPKETLERKKTDPTIQTGYVPPQKNGDDRIAIASEGTTGAKAEAKVVDWDPDASNPAPSKPQPSASEAKKVPPGPAAELAAALAARGVRPGLIPAILEQRSPAEIAQGLQELDLQALVANPGGWLYCHLLKYWTDAPAPSQAETVRAQEHRPAPTTAEREQQRNERLRREADQADQERRQADARLAHEMATGLEALHPQTYAELRTRAVASLGKRGATAIEAIIKGQMLFLLEKG